MRSLDTLAVHAGTLRPRVRGAVVTPIFQTANYEMEDVTSYGAVRYARLSNSPNHELLAARLAALEGSETATVFASGMAAISATLLSLLGSGDHLITQRTLYGGTQTFLDGDASRFGITHTGVDPALPETWAGALRPTTRVFYVESVSNPLMEVGDLAAVVAFARAHDLITVIDNTFLSPVNFRPVPFGFDLVVHSATKYLNGHSDLCAGVVAGSAERVAGVLDVAAHLGGALDAHACFLLERGLKTLGLRVRRQTETADRLARVLPDHPKVARVRYPGLDRPDAPFSGFGGMLAFEAVDEEVAERFVEGVTLPIHAASLGGVESLVVRPSRSSHLGMGAAARAALGITDRLVRVSVGIEDPDELLEDFIAALDRA